MEEDAKGKYGNPLLAGNTPKKNPTLKYTVQVHNNIVLDLLVSSINHSCELRCPLIG